MAVAGEVVVAASMCYLDSSFRSESASDAPIGSDDLLCLRQSGGRSVSDANPQDDSGISAAQTVVEQDEYRDPSLLGLHGIPVAGQGRCGIGINFVMLDDGAMVLPMHVPESLCILPWFLSCDATCFVLQVVDVKEGGPAALNGRVHPGVKVCAVDGKCAAGRTLSVSRT